MTAGHQPESRRQIPWENSLLTSGKGLLGQRDLSAYLERGALDSIHFIQHYPSAPGSSLSLSLIWTPISLRCGALWVGAGIRGTPSESEVLGLS